jgi:replicative DNA helicase
VLTEDIDQEELIVEIDGSQMLKMNDLRAAARRSRQFKTKTIAFKTRQYCQASEKCWNLLDIICR